MSALGKGDAVLALGSLAALALAHAAIVVATSDSVAPFGGPLPAHPASGPATTVIAVAVLVALVIAAAMRLRTIMELDSVRGAFGWAHAAGHAGTYAAAIRYRWQPLFISVLTLYLLVEVLEAGSGGVGFLGALSSIAGHHSVAFPAIALASLLLAAISALADWCRCALATRPSRERPVVRRQRPARATYLRGNDTPLVSRVLAAESWGRSPPHIGSSAA